MTDEKRREQYAASKRRMRAKRAAQGVLPWSREVKHDRHGLLEIIAHATDEQIARVRPVIEGLFRGRG